MTACLLVGYTVRAVPADPAPAAPPPAAAKEAPAPAPAPAPAKEAPAPAQDGPDDMGGMGAPPSMEQAVSQITKRLAFLPDVLATFDKDQKIDKKEFISQAAPVLYGAVGDASATDDQLKVRLKGYVMNAVNLRLVADLAAAAGIKADVEEAKKRLAEIKQRFGAAALQGMSEERVLEEMTRQSLIQQWVEKTVLAKIEIAPADVQALYDERKGELNADAQVHALHILKLVTPDDTPEKKAAAKKAIDELAAKLKAGGDFAALAKDNSDDKESAKEGGDLGFFEQKRVDPAFGKAAFAMKDGEVSDVVESEFGFHIIKVLEHRAAGQLPLDDKLKGALSKYLKEKKAQETVTQTLAAEATKRNVKLAF